MDNQLRDHQHSIMQSYLEPESIHSKTCINHIPSSPCSSAMTSHRCFRFSSLKSKMKKVFRFSSSLQAERQQKQHKDNSILQSYSLSKFPPDPSRSPSVDSVCHPRHQSNEKQDRSSKMSKLKNQFSRNSSVCDMSFSDYRHELPPLPPKSILKKNRTCPNRPKSAIEPLSSQQHQQKTPQRHSFLFLLNRRSHKGGISSTATGRIRFNKLVSVHETWSKQDYDRGSDPEAVCTRLTSQLAQHIKQELNYYKLHEMTVHDSSRTNTHFFL